MIDANKEIKVYGTLRNHTKDSTKGVDSIHHDAIAYAKELYDTEFGDVTPVENYQDNINKRVKGIKYDPNKSGANKPGTTVSGDLYVDGDIYIKVNGEYKPLNLGDIINTLNELKSYWSLDTQSNRIVSTRSAVAPGFYDSTITA